MRTRLRSSVAFSGSSRQVLETSLNEDLEVVEYNRIIPSQTLVRLVAYLKSYGKLTECHHQSPHKMLDNSVKMLAIEMIKERLAYSGVPMSLKAKLCRSLCRRSGIL